MQKQANLEYFRIIQSKPWSAPILSSHILYGSLHVKQQSIKFKDSVWKRWSLLDYKKDVCLFLLSYII
jgi:hypothetical protein